MTKITNLNEILSDWAYRVDGGMPDATKISHLVILEKTLIECGWNVAERYEFIKNLQEAKSKEPKLDDREKEKAKKMGLMWKGQGYGKENEDGITHKNVGGKLVKIDKNDKKEKEPEKKGDVPKGMIKNPNYKPFDRDNKEPEFIKDPNAEKDTEQLSDTEKKALVNKAEKVDAGVSNTIDITSDTTPENKKRIKSLVGKALVGEKLSEEEAEFLSKWVRVVEPTEGSESSPPKYKIYVAKVEGVFKRARGKQQAEKFEFGTAAASKRVHGMLQKAGLITQRVSTFGGKKSAPNQLYSTDGKVNIIEEPKPVLGIDETDDIKKAKDVIKNAPKSLKKGSERYNELQDAKKKVSQWARKSKSVQIGNLKIEKQDLSKYEKGSDEYKKAARNNREMAEFAEKIALGDMEFIDMDEGVYPDSPENRVKVIQSAIGNMVKRFEQLGDKPIAPGIPASPVPDETKEILNRLESIAKADPNGNGDPFDSPQEWMDAFEEVMSEFANDELLREGWSNFAEVYTSIRAMHDNGKGTEYGRCALLPESSTLETVDVMEIDGGRGKGKYVTLDGVSVKKGKGGASALTSKVKKAVMKNDDDGSLRKSIIDITRSHTDIYRDDVNHEKYRQKVINVAKKAGVAEEEINEVVKASKTSKKVSSALKTIMKNRLKDAPKNKKSPEYAEFMENEKKMEVVMRQRLESYYVYSYLSHLAYNEAVLAQDFDNESVLSQKADKGGAKLVREKRIKIDSSNGIDILAYARPTFDVGFTNDGRSKNPGSGRLQNMSEKPGWDFYKSIL